MKTIRLEISKFFLIGGIFIIFLLGYFQIIFAQSTSNSCPTCPIPQPQLQTLGTKYGGGQNPGNLDLLNQDIHLQYQMANSDWKAQKWEQAFTKYKSITQKYPTNPLAGPAYMMAGLYLKYHNKWDEAISEFQKGIILIPGTREAQDAKTSISCIYTSQGKYDEALNLLKEVLSETRDWDQLKHCSYWMKKIQRLKALAKSGKIRSCGPKALAFVFKIKGIRVSEDEVSKAFTQNGFQTSIEDLRRVSELKGLTAFGMRLGFDQLEKVEFPIIALIHPGHYIVIISVDERGYRVIDPEKGERPFRISSREILERDWTGYVLGFGRPPKDNAPNMPLLTHTEMESVKGGVCVCCPEGELGGSEDNPNTQFDIIERAIKGCSTRGGMPKLSVNTANLNLVLEDIDLSFSGRGPKVEIKRTYNSDDPRESVFGRSWTFNYNITLYEGPNGNVMVRRGSGRIDIFSPLGVGAYQPPLGVYDELVKNPDGTYSLWIKKMRETQNFDRNGTLTNIVDQNGNTVTFQYDTSNVPLVWGSYGYEDGQFNYPTGIAVGGGYVYVADQFNSRIQKFDTNGNFILKWGSYGEEPGQFTYPWGVGVDQSGYVYVADTYNNRIQKFDSNGNFILKWGTPGTGDAQFYYPTDVKIDSSGHVYVADYGNNRIQKFDSNGNFILKWGIYGNGDGEFYCPRGVAIDPSNNVYVAEEGNHRVQKFDANGTFITKWGICGSENGQFWAPQYITVDQLGYVYVADHFNHRVQKFDSNGNFITKWGTSWDHQINYPMGITVDQSGYLYVTEYYDNHVKKFLSTLPIGPFLTSITDATGRTTTFTYGENHKVTAVTDPIGRQATFAYDSLGNLISQTDMAGNTTTYTYDPNSYLTSITTPSGPTQITWTYLRGITVTDPLENIRDYYSFDNIIKITDARGNITSYTNNSDGTTSSIEDALGYITSFGYDGNGNRTSITDANGNTTTIGYNVYGDITFIKDPVCTDLNCQTTFTYWNDQDYLKEIIDPRGNKYTFEYDGNWNLRFIKDPLNKIAEFKYDPSGNGQLIEFIDPRQNKRTFTYDSYGNLQTATGPSIGSPPYSLVTTFGYDGVSRVTSITDPRNNITGYEYDGIDRIKKITYPDGRTVEYTYFCCGRNSMKDENGLTTTYQYDADNRLWKVFDPRGGVTAYQYDANGNLRYLIDPKNQTTEFTYDAADRLKTITYPEGIPVEEFDYYPVGTLKWRKNRKSEKTDYAYNKNNRLTSLSSPGPISITYGYDWAGNRNLMTDATGTTTIEHDELNRLKYVIYPGGKRIDYSYDEVGNLKTIATTFGLVSYDYDAYNRLSRITLPNQSVIDYHYDENNYKGNLTSIHHPNGTYTTFDYDTRNRMTGLYNNRPGGVISQYVYTLDGVGNRINVSFEEPLSRVFNLGTSEYSYLPGNFLTSSGTAAYEYDLNGNLYRKIQGGNTTTYTFDSQDRLTNISSPSLNIQYQYDGLFNRVSKTDSGTTTKYLVDPKGFLPQVIAEMDNGENITSYYIYDGIGLVAKMVGSTVYYYHYDGTGNTIAMTDASGNMVNKYAYDEFGNLLNTEETVLNPFLYVGQYGVIDDDNGLLYMRARYYDQEVGRFINKDPIGYWGGINLYNYVANNPINYVDPTGEYAWLAQLLQRIAASPIGQRAAIFLQRFGSQIAALFRSAAPQCTNIVNVTFGHGARHLQGTGLSQQVVENAITQEIQLIIQQASASGSFWGTVEIAGQTILYRAFTVSTGTVHVGTYYPF